MRVPDRTGDLRASDVQTLGLGFDGAAFFGWHHGQWVAADPAKCQLLIIVRSTAEVAQVAAVLDRIKGEPPCLADFSKHER